MTCVAAALGLLLAGCATNGGSDAVVADAVDATARRLEAQEPERVVREFMVALAQRDRDRVLAHMKPNPDVDVLLRMSKPEDEAELDSALGHAEDEAAPALVSIASD